MVYPKYFDVEDWGRLFFRVQVTPQRAGFNTRLTKLYRP